MPLLQQWHWPSANVLSITFLVPQSVCTENKQPDLRKCFPNTACFSQHWGLLFQQTLPLRKLVRFIFCHSMALLTFACSYVLSRRMSNVGNKHSVLADQSCLLGRKGWHRAQAGAPKWARAQAGFKGHRARSSQWSTNALATRRTFVLEKDERGHSIVIYILVRGQSQI